MNRWKQAVLVGAALGLCASHPPVTCFHGQTLSIWLDPPKAVARRVIAAKRWTVNQHKRAMALTVFGECRGCTFEGKRAVAFTILNRVKQGRAVFGEFHVEDVVWAPWQYSCWNKHDPNRALLAHIGRLKKDSPDEIAWTQSKGISGEVVDGIAGPDPTHGATMYYVKGTHVRWDMSKLIRTATIGDHVFFRVKAK